MSRRVPVTFERGSLPALEWPVNVSPVTVTSKSRFNRIGLVTDWCQVTRSPTTEISCRTTVSPLRVAVPAIPRSVTGVRVRHAQELLERTSDSVEAIGHRVGFESAANFRALFRQIAGVPPQSYRNVFRDQTG